MIRWADEGMILSARTHGENAVILDVLTEGHGRHSGVVRGGASRRMRPILQPGAQVSVEWQARLEEHMGAFRVEAKRSRAAEILGDRSALEAIGAIAGLLAMALPEREAMLGLYHRTIGLADRFGGGEAWWTAYARWELALLSDIGFALDLSCCAVTGAEEGLVFVSPKSGRAVSREGAGEWADRLLPLPAFLREDNGQTAPAAEVVKALRLTGFFLQNQVVEVSNAKDMPAARMRLMDLIGRRAREG